MKKITIVLALVTLFGMTSDNTPRAATQPVAQVSQAKFTRIPDRVFEQRFGEKHTFRLTAHGPSPVFVQSGYTFQVDTHGFLLSDEFYYDVPVYIDITELGYRLTSTKQYHYSVEVAVKSGR